MQLNQQVYQGSCSRKIVDPVEKEVEIWGSRWHLPTVVEGQIMAHFVVNWVCTAVQEDDQI